MGDSNNNPNPNPPLSLKGSTINYVIQGFICQGGDFHEGNNGTDGDDESPTSIYGDEFLDVETSARRSRAFDLITAGAAPDILRKHTSPYPYSCGSKFFICLASATLFDNGHVVFGTVMAGRNTVVKTSDSGSCCGIPNKEVKIVDCGLMSPPSFD